MPGPVVAGDDEVTLRTFESADTEFVQRACTNPEIRYPLGVEVQNREQLREWTTSGSRDHFLVCLDGEEAGPEAPDVVEDDRTPADGVRRIGGVTVEEETNRRPELAYWLVPEVHGEGYGRHAVSLTVDYVFRAYDTPSVAAGAFAFNDASCGLLESLGFAEEGRHRKAAFVDGEYVDSVEYGLLREEWDGGSFLDH
jgi:ribosomal-protein-alanine N-acetyltransferase